MHVKEQVREFVHDVKRKFSKKHRRDSTCSTCANSHDGASTYSGVDTLGTLEDDSSSAASSRPGTPERGPSSSFLHLRTSPKRHNHNILHRARRPDGKRYRLFSAPTIPSSRADASSMSSHGRATTEPSSTQKGSMWKAKTSRGMAVATSVPSSVARDCPSVIDIRPSVAMASTRSFCNTGCQTQPHFDMEVHSEASGTLVGSQSDSVVFYSESNSAPALSTMPSFDQIDRLPPVPPPKSEQVVTSSVSNEEVILTSAASPRLKNLEKPTVAIPVVPQASRAVSPAQGSISANPAPIYIPRLTAPSMFLPVPNTDPLNALLTKYVPAEQRPRRDVVGEYAGRDVHEMAMSNSWRALAKMARDKIVASDPEDLARILDLWSLRLSSLARLRLTNQASAECTNLFAVLNAVVPPSVPGSFPGSSLPTSIPVPPSPSPAPFAPLSPSGLSGLAQLPGTPSQKPPGLPAGSPTTARAPQQYHAQHELVHPFELTVLHARVHYWSGDPLGYVDALSRILGQCKQRAREEARVVAQRRGRPRARGDVEEARQPEEANESEAANEEGEGAKESTDAEIQDDAEARDALKASRSQAANKAESEGEEDADESTDTEAQDEAEEQDDVLVAAEANLSMWLERVARVCLILASQLIEMNDYQAAINLLTPLCTQRTAPKPMPSPELHSALARIYLLSGNLSKAKEHFSIAASVAENTESDTVVMNAALMAAASGDWSHAEEALSDLVTRQPGNFTAMNNLAVTLLCQGRIKEGIDLLEAALKTSPSSVVVAEPFLFNLSTMYELRSTAAIDKKRELLIEVARWSGDGLKTSCLKMPSS